MFDGTAEMKAYEVAASVSGVEVFGIRFGFSSRDLAREASKLITDCIGLLCHVPGISTKNETGKLLANGVYLSARYG